MKVFYQAALVSAMLVARTLAVFDETNCLPTCSGNPANEGNGKCNTINNNCACNWDGGDCCGTSARADQYNACGGSEAVCCIDPSNGPDASTTRVSRISSTTSVARRSTTSTERGAPPSTSGRVTVTEATRPDATQATRPGESSTTNGRGSETTTTRVPQTRSTATVTRRSTTSATQRNAPVSTTARVSLKEVTRFNEQLFCAPKCTGKTSTRGNGKCNTINNNCACNWDDGDCCGSSARADQYGACGGSEAVCCTDPTYGTPVTGTTTLSSTKSTSESTTGATTSLRRTSTSSTTTVRTTTITSTTKRAVTSTKPRVTKTDRTTTKPQTTTQFQCKVTVSCQAMGGSPSRINDKKCNNKNNICVCDWDGGDCCGNPVGPNQFSNCGGTSEACCLDPAYTAQEPTTTNAATARTSTNPNPSASTTVDASGDVQLDAHGCVAGTGYTWCEAANACIKQSCNLYKTITTSASSPNLALNSTDNGKILGLAVPVLGGIIGGVVAAVVIIVVVIVVVIKSNKSPSQYGNMGDGPRREYTMSERNHGATMQQAKEAVNITTHLKSNSATPVNRMDTAGRQADDQGAPPKKYSPKQRRGRGRGSNRPSPQSKSPAKKSKKKKKKNSASKALLDNEIDL